MSKEDKIAKTYGRFLILKMSALIDTLNTNLEYTIDNLTERLIKELGLKTTDFSILESKNLRGRIYRCLEVLELENKIEILENKTLVKFKYFTIKKI